MLCRYPYMLGNQVPVRCGRCLACRISRRREWSWRMFLESLCHDESCFVTLTYNDDHFPSDRSLSPRAASLWLKRLRRYLAEYRIRFYLCGEYDSSGSRDVNPHYHACLFGVGPWVGPLVSKSWSLDGEPLGFTSTYEFNQTTAQYVAGYVLKKMNDDINPALEGLYPAFSRMSNRPGLGANAIPIIAEALFTDAGQMEVLRTGDVPMSLRLGRKTIPLDRYLRSKLREEFGLPKSFDDARKARFFEEKRQEFLSLLSAAEASGKKVATWERGFLVADAYKQAFLNQQARFKVHNRRLLK